MTVATKVAPKIVAAPTEAEQAELAQKDARLTVVTEAIQSAQMSFVVIADGVFEIDDQSLFIVRKNAAGEKYKKLAQYTAEQFEMSPQDTTRYRNGGEVLKILRSHEVTVLPRNESQTRALWKLHVAKGDAQMVARWNKVVKEGKPTADAIEGKKAKQGGMAHRKGARRPSGTMPPVSIVVDAEPEAVEKLSNALGLKPKKADGVFRYTSNARTNFELILNKIADWFGEKGRRSIDIHLSK
jgi:hypothetical protein